MNKLILTALITAFATHPALADDSRHYVVADAADCINTFTLKVVTVASLTGRAFGEYDGVGFRAERFSNAPCLVGLLTRRPDGAEERASLRCISGFAGSSVSIIDEFPPGQ